MEETQGNVEGAFVSRSSHLIYSGYFFLFEFPGRAGVFEPERDSEAGLSGHGILGDVDSIFWWALFGSCQR